jgi:hypothetical protein
VARPSRSWRCSGWTRAGTSHSRLRTGTLSPKRTPKRTSKLAEFNGGQRSGDFRMWDDGSGARLPRHTAQWLKWSDSHREVFVAMWRHSITFFVVIRHPVIARHCQLDGQFRVL